MPSTTFNKNVSFLFGPHATDGLDLILKGHKGKLTSEILFFKDRDRILKQLNDVQRECTALLDDNNRLEDENRKLEERDANHMTKIQELEDLIAERERELQQVCI